VAVCGSLAVLYLEPDPWALSEPGRVAVAGGMGQKSRKILWLADRVPLAIRAKKFVLKKFDLEKL